MKSIYSKSLLTKSVVRTGIIVASLALAGNAFAANGSHVAAKTAPPPQVMYKDITRPNGQKRSDAVYQADVDACRQQTGGSLYLPDSAAMKKCMLGDGFRFVWQRGFGSGSGGAVASSSGSSDYDYTPPPDTSAQDAVGWAVQQSAIDATNQASQEITQEANDMAASMAAANAENALANDMTNQYMMNQVNSQ
jgi:hypothetical protein